MVSITSCASDAVPTWVDNESVEEQSPPGPSSALPGGTIDPPEDVNAVLASPNEPGQFNSVYLTWASDAAGDVSGYFVYRREEGGEFEPLHLEPVPSLVTNFVDKGLERKKYLYAVAAVDAEGHVGRLSEVVSVVPFEIDLTPIPSGSFWMGSPDKGKEDENPLHRVTISRPFLIGTFEVTQAQWEAVMGTNPSRFAGCAQCPVEQVSWYDAKAFVERLNELSGTSLYRLPTEAEWEYAARAGTSETRFFGEDITELSEYAWFKSNSGTSTLPVGGKKPNPWGLYDIYGNVFEWVEDWYGESYYEMSPVVDPQGPESGTLHAPRGASYICDKAIVRSTFRGNHGLGDSSYIIGFRIAATIP